MSLLQKASIITTPTAYAEDYLYSIKPAYALGTELVTNGTFATDSGWTKGSAWTISGGKAVYDDSAINSISQSLSFTSQKRYQIQFVVSDATGSGARIKFSNVADSVIYFDYAYYTNGLHTLFYKASANSSEINIKGHTFGSSFKLDNVSVKEITDADFDFDRNSTGTRVNEDYLIEDVPYNFVTYSEEIKSTNSWTIQSGVTVTNNDVLAPNGTLTADKLVGNGTTGVFKQVTNLDGVITRSVYLKSVTGNVSVTIKDPVLTQTTKTLNLNETWQRYTLTEDNLHTGSIQGIWIDDIPSSGIYMWGAQIVKGDQPKDYLKTTDRLDIPRIDYTNGEPSILLEPSRTNLETKSQDIANWGLVSNVTRTASYTQSPEGLNNATRLQFTANGYTASFTQSNSTQYTLSCYAKRNDKGTQNFGFFTNGSGTVDSQFALTSTWQRFTYTYTSTNTSYAGLAGLSGADVSVYGMQIEAGSYATSLIHTSGSAVSRSADAATNAGNSDLINSTEGVLYVEFKTPEPQPTAQYIAINDGAAGTNQVRIGWLNFKIYIQIRVAGSAFYTFNPSTPTHTEFNKIAVKFKASDHAIYINGQEVDTSTASNIFSSNVLNTLSFSAYTTTGKFYGNVKSIAVFKEALTDLELEKLTGYNNHELYMNYYNRLSYLGLAEEYNVESDINNYIL